MARVEWSHRPIQNDKFTLRNGESCRVAVLDAGPEMILDHYLGKHFQCLSPEPDCPFCSAGVERKERFALYVLVYSQNQGTVMTPLAGTVVPWFFGSDKYLFMHAIAKASGDLRTVDLMLTCTEEKFQRFVITPCAERLWTTDQAFMAKVGEMYQKLPKDLGVRIATKVSKPEALIILQRGVNNNRNQPGGPPMGRGGFPGSMPAPLPQALPAVAPAAPLPPSMYASNPAVPLPQNIPAAVPTASAPPAVPGAVVPTAGVDANKLKDLLG